MNEPGENLEAVSASLNQLKQHVNRYLIGQTKVVEQVLVAILSGGHVLIEGVPGLGKTLLVQVLASGIGGTFNRIQFTPDLMPGDITGHVMFDMGQSKFILKRGPVFTNLLLADEINRAPAKTQAALLEVMQEYQVTLDGQSLEVEQPFMVLATQNPIEQEGTYPLPEAQIDRFMLKLRIGYPSKQEERQIIDLASGDEMPVVRPVVSTARIIEAQKSIRRIYMDEKVKDYILDLVFATREPEKYNLDIKHLVAYGASPRASVYLAQAARAHSFLRGRGYVTPEDVKAGGFDVLRHRVITTYEAEAESVTSEDVLQRIFDVVEVP